MNNPRAVKQIYLQPFPYEKALANIDTALGYFSIGFLPQTKEYRAKMRAGKTNNEHVNHVMAESLGSVESNAPPQRNGVIAKLFSILPSEFLLGAIRHMTSTFDYSHCEMAFLLKDNSPLRNEKVNVISVAIHADVGVFMAPRKFHEEYEWHHVTCNEIQMKAILFFAYQEQGKRFSAELMSKSVVNPGPDDRSVYFCSHFTMACLEFLPNPVFHFNRANAQTIDDIYAMVTSEEVRAKNVSSIPQAQSIALFGETQPDAVYIERPSKSEEALKKNATRKKV